MNTENTKSSLKINEAKIEFLALKEAVDNKLRAGYSVRAVYEELVEGGHLRMSYSTFSGYIRRSGSRYERLGVGNEQP